MTGQNQGEDTTHDKANEIEIAHFTTIHHDIKMILNRGSTKL